MKRGFDEASCLKSSSGDKRFRLVVSRNWSGPGTGKSSSGDWKIAESDFGWTKSSQKSLCRWKWFSAPLVRWYHYKFCKYKCHQSSILPFYGGLTESSLAPQFKWLDNAFNIVFIHILLYYTILVKSRNRNRKKRLRFLFHNTDSWRDWVMAFPFKCCRMAKNLLKLRVKRLEGTENDKIYIPHWASFCGYWQLVISAVSIIFGLSVLHGSPLHKRRLIVGSSCFYLPQYLLIM